MRGGSGRITTEISLTAHKAEFVTEEREEESCRAENILFGVLRISLPGGVEKGFASRP